MAKQRNINIVYKVNKKELDEATRATDRAKKSTQDLGNKIKETESVGVKAFKALASAVTLVAIGGLIKKIVELGAAQQQLNIAFTTFLGDANKAKKLIAELTQFSIVTPFTPEQVNKAAKSLLAFGVQAKDIIKTLKFLGDVSAGTGKDLGEMAIIFGQIRSTGRLMGQDLLQLINAGFNPLQIISQKTGKAVVDLKKDMEKGLITFDMVQQAFIDATSAGGLFFNLMEEQSASIGGKLSTIAGNISEIAKGIFESNINLIDTLVTKLTEYTAAFNEILNIAYKSDPILERAQKNFESWTTSIDDTGESIDLIGKAIERINKIGDTSEANQLFKTLTEGIAEYTESADDLEKKVQQSTGDEFQRLNAQLEVERLTSKLLLDARNKLQKDSQDALIKYQIKEAELAKTAVDKELDFSTLLYETKLELQKKFEKDYQDAIEAGNEEQARIIKDAYNKEIDEKMHQDELKQKAADDFRKKEIEAEKKHQEQINQVKTQAFYYGLDLIQQALEASTQVREIDLDEIRSKYDEEISMLRGREKEMTATDRRILELEKQRDKELEDARKKQAELDKRVAIKKMIIENILNSIRALGVPPVPNFPLAAITLGYGTAQVGIAKAVGFKDGVIDLQGPGTKTSDSIPARLSKHESVMTADETQSSKGILKEIRARKLDDRIFEKIKNGGGAVPIFDDGRIVSAIERNKVDLSRQGSILYETRRISENMRIKTRAKILNR